MTPEAIETLFKVLGPVAVIWLTWVTVSHWKTKSELDALKLYVAENYAKNDALKAIDNKLEAISGMVHTLIGRLGASSSKE